MLNLVSVEFRAASQMDLAFSVDSRSLAYRSADPVIIPVSKSQTAELYAATAAA